MHLSFIPDFQNWQPIAWSALAIVSASLAGLLLHRLFFWLARRINSRRGQAKHLLLEHTFRPARLAFPLLLVSGVLQVLPLAANVKDVCHHLISLLLIATFAWLAIEMIGYAEARITLQYDINVADNLRARRIQTQVQLFRRVAISAVALAAAALMLITFPAIWSLGASILASAGVAGLVIGMAARPALANLIAGVQVALTEPIRIEDVVIVENEWGKIEEVNTTYVVVRTWDLRRLIVPLTYFIEKPFQNWTRTSTDLVGTVFVHADYGVSVEALREELRRALDATPLWDKKTCVLQMTEAKEQNVEIRALVSAANAGALWDLRCFVRERLVQFLQEKYPETLPRLRVTGLEAIK